MENKIRLNLKLNSKFKSRSTFSLFPLTALALGACGGGGSSGSGGNNNNLNQISGNVIKGPLVDYVVFSDTNGNFYLDEGEPETTTDVNGAFTLTATNPNATIYAIYNSISSYDTSTNSTPTAGFLSATPEASVISPASTLLVNNSNLTVQQLAKSLGLEGIDLLNFNPYAAGVNATQALSVEKVSHQIQNVINSTQASMTLSTDTSNITPEIQKELLNMGFKVVGEVMRAKAALDQTVDLSSSDLMTEIKNKTVELMTAHSTISSITDLAKLNEELDNLLKAAENVNTVVKSVSDLSSDNAKGALTLGAMLVDQIDNYMDKNEAISLTDYSNAVTLSNNIPPIIKSLSNSTFTENTTDSVVGRVIVEDESTSNLKFFLHGDQYWLNIDQSSGVVNFRHYPNYEEKSSFSITIQVIDEGGKSTFQDFTITVINANDNPTGVVTVSGTAAEGRTLSADVSSVADEDGITTFSYQWMRGDVPITGATNSTYTLTQADVDNTVAVAVSFIDGLGNKETLATSAPSSKILNINDAPTGSLIIVGTTAQDSVLTANTSSIADQDGLGDFSFQWYRGDEAISGATSSTYTLGTDDVGKTIKVLGTYTDGAGAVETITSAQTSLISNKNDAPTGKPVISGTVEEDSVLTLDTSSIADADGLGSFTINWLRNGSTVETGTSSTYTLKQEDVNSVITAQVTYTDGGNVVETLLSDATSAVQNINDEPTGKLNITGNPTQGSTLSVLATNIIDEDGITTLSYQWMRDDAQISDATNSTYTLTQDDVGKQIKVTASYTDTFGTLENVSSDPSSIIATQTIGAFSVTNTGTGSNLVLDFYLDSSLDAGGDGFGSLEAKIGFTNSELVYTDGSFATGLIGAIGDTNKSNGVLELGAISYPNYTDLTNPIFTLNMTDLDLANSSTLTVSDVFMDGGTLSGSTLVIA